MLVGFLRPLRGLVGSRGWVPRVVLEDSLHPWLQACGPPGLMERERRWRRLGPEGEGVRRSGGRVCHGGSMRASGRRATRRRGPVQPIGIGMHRSRWVDRIARRSRPPAVAGRTTPAMPAPLPPRPVHCAACGTSFSVPARAVSFRCPKCTAPYSVDDVVVSHAQWNGAIQTDGCVHIALGAHYRARSLHVTEHLYVEGVVDSANAACGGTAHLASSARWRGDCRAARLVVEEGAVIEGGYFEIGAGARSLPAA